MNKKLRYFLFSIWANTFYSLIIIPLGFILRFAEIDPLKRALEPQRKSYWEKK